MAGFKLELESSRNTSELMSKLDSFVTKRSQKQVLARCSILKKLHLESFYSNYMMKPTTNDLIFFSVEPIRVGAAA